MEIFIAGIPPSATLYDLHEALVPILHGTSFAHYHTSGRPFNFIVRIFAPKEGGRGRLRRTNVKNGLKHGRLLVPSPAIGQYFLDCVRRDEGFLEVRILGNRLNFRVGNQKPTEEELRQLDDAYADPQALKEDMERRAKLSGSIDIRDAEFGWRCHDDVISVEASLSTIAPLWSISFDIDHHHVILDGDGGMRMVLRINAMHATIEGEKCLLWLDQPPLFDQERRSPTPDRDLDVLLGFLNPLWGVDFDFDLPEIKVRDRLSSPHPQSQIFAYMRVICISFNHRDKLGIFEQKARTTRLPIEVSAPHDLVERKLFSPENMAMLRQCLMSHPFNISFQLEALLSRCVFHPSELLELEPSIQEALNQFEPEKVATLIRSLESQRGRLPRLSATELFRGLCEDIELPYEGTPRRVLGSRLDRILMPAGSFYCHRATVTPTSVVLTGPLPDETNRVIRQFYDYRSNFLRVEFREEDRLQLRQDGEVDTNAFIDKRFGDVLRDGMIVAGRKFELLGWSSSALREHAVWFIHPFQVIQDGKPVVVNGDYIRSNLGDFSKVIKYPARYGARIGQAFSATEPTSAVELHEIINIDDKTSNTIPPSVFTDGVGPISPELAAEIWNTITKKPSKRHLKTLPPPSAFQVRFGGAKGVLCVWDNMRGSAHIAIRPSMNKFECRDSVVEVAKAFDRPMDTFLNRPLVMLLETLGVPLGPLMDLQRSAVDRTLDQSSLSSSAARLIEESGLGGAFNLPSTLSHCTMAHGDPDIIQRDGDPTSAIAPFLQRVVRFAVNHILREIKYKARIRVPNAWTLVGVADEHDYLAEGEIYACVRKIDGEVIYIEGPVLISRSPTVHPGDARMVRAIGRPPAFGAGAGFSLLFNCVVFSCRGRRSLPSMLAGGDLDGDIYALILDRNLHITENKAPEENIAAPWLNLQRPSTARDLANFVADYIKNDLLGVISTQLLRTADQAEKCMEDPDCLKLASLHSTAVDFPKTGTPVRFGDLPFPPKGPRPDWESGEAKPKADGVAYYTSQRHLGYLYRAVELPAVPEAKRAARRQVRLRRKRKQQEENELYAEDIHGIFATSMDKNPVTRTLIRRIKATYSVDQLETDSPDILEEMLAIFETYVRELEIICSARSVVPSRPLLEEEIVAGSIVASCSQYKLRKANIAAMRRESIDLCIMIKDAIRGVHLDEDEQSEKNTLRRAWNAWKVSVACEDSFGGKSFGLLACNIIFAVLG